MDAFEKQKRDGVAIDLHRSCELYSPNTGGGGIKRHESRIEIYIPTIDRARRECKVRNEESRFLSSLSLSLSFSTSIAIPPARFLVNQGIFPLPPARMQSHHRCRAASSFLPSFPSKEREGESRRVSSMEFHIYPGVACSDSKRMRRHRKHSSVFRRESRIG